MGQVDALVYLKKELQKKTEELNALQAIIDSLENLVKPSMSNEQLKQKSATKEKLPGYLKEDSICMLRLLYSGPKSLEVLSSEYRDAGYDVGKKTLVSRLSYYKREFGFIESAGPGLYAITDRAKAYIDTRYPLSIGKR